MSENVSITESGKTRNFNGVGAIETETPEGDSCFWVPESERELETEYVIKNGDYRPKKYAFSELDVNIIDLIGDYEISIDDYDLPHIDLDGIDITIDETGIPHINFDYEIVTVDNEKIKVIDPDGKEVIIHGPDLDGPVNIDDVFSIDYDKETGTWTITAIVNVTSGDNEFAPGDIVAQWPGTEHVDIHIGQSISIPDLGDIDLDFDADIDVSVDLDDMDVDISGIDMDGLDVDVNIDLDTLNIDTFELPDEIRIMHVPNKTSYKYGEEIDLDGIEVKAFRNGEVWEGEDGKYLQGYIPVHELSIASAFDNRKRVSPYLRSIGIDGIPIDKICDGKIKMHSQSTTSDMEWFFDIGEGDAGIVIEDYDGRYAYGIVSSKDKTKKFSYHYITLAGDYKDESTTIQSNVTNPNYFEHEVSYYMTNGLRLGGTSLYHYEGPPRFKLPQSTQIGLITQTIQNLAYYILYREEPDIASVTVSWPRPHDHKILSATFNISVEEGDTQPSGNAGGTDGTPNGHWGGTTTSGDHGGSHYSGKF